MSFPVEPSEKCLDALISNISLQYLQSSPIEEEDEKGNRTILQQHRQQQYLAAFRKWAATGHLVSVTALPNPSVEFRSQNIPAVEWKTAVITGGVWGCGDHTIHTEAGGLCAASGDSGGFSARDGTNLKRNEDEASFKSKCVGRLKQQTSGFSTGMELLHDRICNGDAKAAETLDQINKSLCQSLENRTASTGLRQGLESPGSICKQGNQERANLARTIAERLGGEIREDVVTVVLSMLLNTKTDTPVLRSDIAGLQNVKKLVQDKIIYPIRRPDLHRGLHQAPRGILLFGPPGTGKTMIAKWVAAESGASFFEVTPSSLISKYHGETETLVRTLFRVAEISAPSVIFIDEIDSLLGKRRDNDDDSSIRMKNQLLQMMDGVSSNNAALVVVVGATNRPDTLDEAALRRLPRRILVPLPDQLAREAQIMRLLEKHQEFGIRSSLTSSDPLDKSKCERNFASHDHDGEDGHSQSKRRRRHDGEYLANNEDDQSKFTAATCAEQPLDTNPSAEPPAATAAVTWNQGMGLTQEELKLIAAKLDGWNGSDIRALCGKAAEYSFDETVLAYGGVDNIPGAFAFRPICYDDFLRALEEGDTNATALKTSRVENCEGVERLLEQS